MGAQGRKSVTLAGLVFHNPVINETDFNLIYGLLQRGLGMSFENLNFRNNNMYLGFLRKYLPCQVTLTRQPWAVPGYAKSLEETATANLES